MVILCLMRGLGGAERVLGLVFQGLEQETGFGLAPLCLGSRSDLGPLPSTRVRCPIFDKILRRFRGSLNIRDYPPPSIRLATDWLKCPAPFLQFGPEVRRN